MSLLEFWLALAVGIANRVVCDTDGQCLTVYLVLTVYNSQTDNTFVILLLPALFYLSAFNRCTYRTHVANRVVFTVGHITHVLHCNQSVHKPF